MPIIIDTSILIDVENKKEYTIKKLERCLDEDKEVAVSSPTVTEFYYGGMESEKKIKSRVGALRKYKLLNTNFKSSLILAEIKKQLESEGKAIPIFDLIIASIALANNALLVSKDVHFEEIRRLKVAII